QVPANGEAEVAPEPPVFSSPTYIGPAVESPVAPAIESVIEPSAEPAIEQAEPELVAAVAEETFPSEPASEWELSKPLEAQGNLQTEVCEGMTDEGVAFPEIEEQISTQESSQEPEPVAAVAEEAFPSEPVREG